MEESILEILYLWNDSVLWEILQRDNYFTQIIQNGYSSSYDGKKAKE